MSDPAKTRILVTGGAGFIGRSVVDRLLHDGFSPIATTFDLHKARPDPPSNIELVELDLTDPLKVQDIVTGYKPEIVLHLAGVTGNSDPTGKIYDEVNFKGTVNLLESLEQTGVSRIVMLGTAAEYGDQLTPFREDMPLCPVSPYAVSKARASQFALEMHRTRGLPLSMIRIFTAYGIGQPSKMFLSQLITHAVLNRHFNMSDGVQRRDFVHISDVVGAVRAAMTTSEATGRVINVGSGQGVALRDVAQKVWQICDADADLLHIGARDKSGDDCFDTEADISVASAILNWSPGPGILDEIDDFSRLREMIQEMKKKLGPASSNGPEYQ